MRNVILSVAAFAAISAVYLFLRWPTVTQAATSATLPSYQDDQHMSYKQAIFAAGCFWGVESAFRHTPGVVATEVGYTGGHIANPSYRQVCTHTTGHAEAVRVTYDPAKISYPELLDIFWTSHDPTQLNRQGPDIGDSYRTAIFYLDEEQHRLAQLSLDEIQSAHLYKRPVVSEITAASTFFKAEDYHQQYFEKQGVGAEVCHVGPVKVRTHLAAEAEKARLSGQMFTAPASPASPAATTQPAAAIGASCSPTDPNASCGTSHWKELTDAEMRAKLTPEQYKIARQAGTERPFTGKYWNEHRTGTFYCAVCGQELFSSDTKFESGTGWPSFYQPIAPSDVTEKTDNDYGMVRTEVLCSRCHSHLGHVFPDGPRPTGLRYCINSAVLDFKTDQR